MEVKDFINQLGKKSSPVITEALDTPAQEAIETLDEKVSWGYVPEKEYNGRRYLVAEKGEDEWFVFDFVQAKGQTPTSPSPEMKGESTTSEILRYQALVENLYSTGNVAGNAKLKAENGKMILEGKIIGPGKGKIIGPGKGNGDFLQKWFLVSCTPYNFENCLKKCVEIVTGKDTGAVSKGGAINLAQFKG